MIGKSKEQRTRADSITYYAVTHVTWLERIAADLELVLTEYDGLSRFNKALYPTDLSTNMKAYRESPQPQNLIYPIIKVAASRFLAPTISKHSYPELYNFLHSRLMTLCRSLDKKGELTPILFATMMNRNSLEIGYLIDSLPKQERRPALRAKTFFNAGDDSHSERFARDYRNESLT